MSRFNLRSKKIILFALNAFLIVGLLYGSHLCLSNANSTDSSHGTAPVIIRWSTRREEKTSGYVLYRAENRTGPFRQVTRELVPAAHDPYLGGTYVYTDTDTIAGITYYYQLEDVSVDGQRTRQEPISVTARMTSPTVFGFVVPNPIDFSDILIVLTGIALGSTIIFWRE